MRGGAAPVDNARHRAHRPVHGHSRRDHRQRGTAIDPEQPALRQPARPAVGGQRLRSVTAAVVRCGARHKCRARQIGAG
jgi:hypothetical protein